MRIWQKWANHRFKVELGQAFAAESHGLSPVLDAAAENRIWSRLAPSLEPRRQAVRPRTLWLASAGLLASCAVAIFMLAPRLATPPVDFSVKGPAAIPPPTIVALSLAHVGPDRSVIPGHEGMRIAVGTPLIFSVEAQGAATGNPLSLQLAYRLGEGGTWSEIARHTLTQDRQTLARPGGYLSFTPTEPGAYEFRIVSLVTTGVSPDARFHVQVVAP